METDGQELDSRNGFTGVGLTLTDRPTVGRRVSDRYTEWGRRGDRECGDRGEAVVVMWCQRRW